MTGYRTAPTAGKSHSAQPGRDRRTRRHRWFKVLLAFGGGILALGLGEAVVRLIGPGPLGLDTEYRARYQQLFRLAGEGQPRLYELRPGAETSFAYFGPTVHYRISADGLRADRRYARPKPAGTRRVVMIGDSVLFGIGVRVEELFSTILERQLEGVEVVNGGVGGYNTYLEQAWLKTVGLHYEPDLLVLCYCPNDVDDPFDHFSQHTVERLPPFPPDAIPNPSYHAKRRDSRSQGDRRSPSPMAFLKSAAMWTVRHSALANLCARPFSGGRMSHTYERCILALGTTDTPEHAWLKQRFQAIAETARQGHVRVLFVYIPLAYELDSDSTAYARSRRHVNELAASCGLIVVDVMGALAETGRSHLDVSHLAPAGHRAVAGVLLEPMRHELNAR